MGAIEQGLIIGNKNLLSKLQISPLGQLNHFKSLSTTAETGTTGDWADIFSVTGNGYVYAFDTLHDNVNAYAKFRIVIDGQSVIEQSAYATKSWAFSFISDFCEYTRASDANVNGRVKAAYSMDINPPDLSSPPLMASQITELTDIAPLIFNTSFKIQAKAVSAASQPVQYFVAGGVE